MNGPCSDGCLLGFGGDCHAAQIRVERFCELVALELLGQSPETDYVTYIRLVTITGELPPDPPQARPSKPRIPLGQKHPACPECKEKQAQNPTPAPSHVA